MIKKEPNSVVAINETLNTIKNNNETIVYLKLLSQQQDGIIYESIKEMLPLFVGKSHKSYKTLQKYLKRLIEKGLIIKYKRAYLINLIPMKRQ